MAIIKAVSSRASIGNAINYVSKNEKTEEKLISGINCSPETAIEEMKATKEVWQKTDGRQYKHFVHSFPPDEKITPGQAHELAKELCKERFKGYEILIATHKDKEHIHSHIIVNSVSFEDGHKLQQSKADLDQMKKDCNELSRRHGLSVPKKGDEVTTYNLAKYKALEHSITGEYKSYILDCYKSLLSVKEQATSRADFISKMKEQGYETKWADSRKHITFTDKEGNKVRNTNLQKTFKESFGKEELEHGFERNLEKANIRNRATEQSRGLGINSGIEQPIGGSQAVNTDLTIDQLIATIGKAKADISRDDRQRADRISQEQSSQRQRNRTQEQRAIEKSYRSQGLER